jgi:N-glycosylase/DNA lyase
MFSLVIPYFDLNKTYESGQHLNWFKVRDNKYIVCSNGKSTVVEQMPHDRFVFGCNENEFFDFWYNYFDINTDYEAIQSECSRLSSDLKAMTVRSKGVHLINQPLWESVVNNLCKNSMIFIYKEYGTKLTRSFGDAGKHVVYQCPSYDDLISNGKIIDSNLSHICKVLEDHQIDLSIFVHNNYRLYEQSVPKCHLMPQAAYDKIVMYGTNNHSIFPATNGMKKYIEKQYGFEWDDFYNWCIANNSQCSVLYQYLVYDVFHNKEKA